MRLYICKFLTYSANPVWLWGVTISKEMDRTQGRQEQHLYPVGRDFLMRVLMLPQPRVIYCTLMDREKYRSDERREHRKGGRENPPNR